jgi:hypothetical protein
MKLKPIPNSEKNKEMAKLLAYIRGKIKEDDSETNLYYACQTAGYILYEFLIDYIEE